MNEKIKDVHFSRKKVHLKIFRKDLEDIVRNDDIFKKM